jgi:tRNA threonylcarbamoyladenosine biosynthesis protein TsaB
VTVVLAISTSTSRGSIALAGPEGVLAEASHDVLEAHAERLFGLIDAVVARAGMTPDRIGAVACDVGPGSFTGVRVGVASAAGIAAALGVPALGVGSLASMANAAAAARGGASWTRALVALDAKKDEVYLGAFDQAASPLAPARHVRRLDAAAELREALADPHAVVVGEIVGELLPEFAGGERWVRADGADGPTAAWIARVALLDLAAGRPMPLEPTYVREPDVTRSA